MQSSTKLKEGDKISLVHVEYGYNVTRFELSLKNRDYAQINDLLSSRIAFLNNTETDNIIFELYSSYINRYWLFLVNSSEIANNLLLRDDYVQKELYINGIIIPKRLQYKLPSDNKNPLIPIFELDDSEIDYLSLLDIRNTKKNIYFIFDIARVIGNYPETYLLINALVGCILGIALFIYWKILIKVTRFIYVFTLHKFLYTLPFFITVLGVLFISKAIDLEGKNPYQINDDSMFLDTALFTINSIYRTLLWFFILLICCGWKITIQSLRTEDLKFLMRMLLITYVVTSLDQMIDSNDAQIAIIQNDVMSYAYNATDMFAGETPIQSFSAIASAYPESVQIVANKSITSIEQLRGKRVSVGDAGSGTEFNCKQILGAYDIDMDKDIIKNNQNFGDSCDSLKNGTLDAAFITAGHPTVAVTELATNFDFNILNIDDAHAQKLINDYGFYTKVNIEKDSYSVLTNDVQTVAVMATFIANNKLSEDIVYKFTKSLFEEKANIGHQKAELLDPKTGISGISIPFHPGAEKYYKEQGLK